MIRRPVRRSQPDPIASSLFAPPGLDDAQVEGRHHHVLERLDLGVSSVRVGVPLLQARPDVGTERSGFRPRSAGVFDAAEVLDERHELVRDRWMHSMQCRGWRRRLQLARRSDSSRDLGRPLPLQELAGFDCRAPPLAPYCSRCEDCLAVLWLVVVEVELDEGEFERRQPVEVRQRERQRMQVGVISRRHPATVLGVFAVYGDARRP